MAGEAERLRRELEEVTERYRSYLDGTSDGIYRVEMTTPVPVDLPLDEQVRLFYRNAVVAEANDVMARMYGLPGATALVGKRVLELHGTDTDPANLEAQAAFIANGYRADGVETVESGLTGDVRHFLNSGFGVVRDGCLVRVWGTQVDVTERRRQEEGLRTASLSDPLTALPTCALLLDRIGQNLARARRTPGSTTALVAIGLEGLDSLERRSGPAGVDEVVREASRRLAALVRPTDTLARLPDGFALLLTEVREPEDALRVAERALERLRLPFAVAGSEGLAPSAGIATLGGGYGDASALLADAMAARDRARREGGGGTALFDVGVHFRAVARLELEAGLRAALSLGQLELVFEPAVSLVTGRVAGFCAVPRWRHPSKGLLPADEWLPLAEASGQALPITRWILAEACRQASAWNPPGRVADAVWLRAPVPAAALADPAFADVVSEALTASSLRPSLLRLAVEEPALPRAGTSAAGRVARLGVRLSLVRFGRGGLDPAEILDSGVDDLVLDPSLTARLGGNGREELLVAAILSFARALGLPVTAVDVDSVAQVEWLRSRGAAAIRGQLAGGIVTGPQAALLAGTVAPFLLPRG